MGVLNLWKALERGGAVEELVGSQAGQHAQIMEALENKVVAVDLSAWLMQAQSQPALLEHLDSPYARAVKVVFDRTIHWLRYGCLPVFVIEGRTPAAKLDKLRARCVAQYGPSGYSVNVGNREGGQFDRLGRAVKHLLDALAVGEAEAMCAALNVCGWVHAVHTADVDALLFGALTVYRQVELQTRDPRASKLVRCCMYDVRRVLGINSGGDAALMAVAHLAGGDYDMGGAENVGEALALGAVRQLLAGSQDDELVLQRLEAAVARGPDPELEALTKCTGCKACGHEGNRKNKIQAHSAKNGCAACGCEDGCKPRDFTQCECAFHARADERLLNRVVRRAVATPNFMASFRTAAAAYAEQTRSAIASVQREYGLPMPGSIKNVFSWSCRPDVRAVSDIMCGYIKEWDYRQVRLKLLPLLLEWDVRQGPRPGPSLQAQVQFRPSSIRKVSSRGADAEDVTGVPTRQQKGWRYVLLVDRLPGTSQATGTATAAAAAAGADGVAGGVGTAGGQAEAEDLVIDQSWIARTARSRLPKQQDPAAAAAAAAGGMGGSQQQQAQGADSTYLLGGDDLYEGDAFFATQMPSQAGLGSPSASRPLSSQQQQQPSSAVKGLNSSQGGSQGGGSGGASGRGGGTLEFAEGRSVRCSLVDAVWPDLTAAFRQPAASGGRARSGGASRKKQSAAASGGAAGAAAGDDKQRTVKDFFNVAKDYTAPGRQPAKLPASEGGTIPGLAGLASGGASSQTNTQIVAAAAVAGTAAAASGQQANAAAGRDAAAAAAAAARHASAAAAAAAEPQGFMEWLQLQDQGRVEQPQPPSSIQQQPDPTQQQHQQQHDPQQSQQQHEQQQLPQRRQQQELQQTQQQQQQQQQPQRKGLTGRRALSGVQSGKAGGSSGGRGAGSGNSRARKKQAAAKTPCKAGPLDRFLQRPAAAAAAEGDAVQGDAAQHARQPLVNHQEQQQHDLQMQDDLQQEGQQMGQSVAAAAADAADSPEVPSLAARLAAKAAAAGAGVGREVVGLGSQAPAHRASPRSRQRPDSGHSEAEVGATAEAAAGGDSSSPLLLPPAKKASTPLAKELLGSPAKAAAGSSSSPDLVQHGGVGGGGAAVAAAGRYNPLYESLLQQMGVVSPEEQQQDQQNGGRAGGRAVKGCLFGQERNTRPSNLAQPPAQTDTECIELLDSPIPL